MIEIGDCREIMRRWVAEGVRVQMCVTSPPYWGLRDYGVDGQLGLEPTPEAYVTNMVDVFRLVRDLLADDGVLWLNLGDSYCGGGGHSPDAPSSAYSKSGKYGDALIKGAIKPGGGIKQKDLVGIPWAVAFALRADGWYLRSDIIWSKPNPMPESVTDRPTKAHEYVFLMSKSERYHYDAAAIREPQSESALADYARRGDARPRAQTNSDAARGGQNADKGLRANGGAWDQDGRNRRTVWEIPTQPYSGAHFATFPEALVEPCILAGSRLGDVVLDPFMGSGTVGRVATRLGRGWRGCELNPAYKALQDERTTVTGGLALA